MVIGSIQRIRLRTDFEAGLSSEHTLVATGWALARSLLPVFAQRIVSQSRENSPAAHITPILSIHHLYTIYIHLYTISTRQWGWGGATWWVSAWASAAWRLVSLARPEMLTQSPPPSRHPPPCLHPPPPPPPPPPTRAAGGCGRWRGGRGCATRWRSAEQTAASRTVPPPASTGQWNVEHT